MAGQSRYNLHPGGRDKKLLRVVEPRALINIAACVEKIYWMLIRSSLMLIEIDVHG